MLVVVVSFLLLPAIFNAEKVGGEDNDVGIQASVRLLEDQLQQLYDEKGDNSAISGYEAELSDLYNALGEEDEETRFGLGLGLGLGLGRRCPFGLRRLCRIHRCRLLACRRCPFCRRG